MADFEEKRSRKSSVSMVQEDPVETIATVEEVPIPIPEPEEVWPKKYVCTIKCWVASRVRIYDPGDEVDFHQGEYVPTHFRLL